VNILHVSEKQPFVGHTHEYFHGNGRPKKPGSINGGFFQKSSDKPDQYPAVVIAVDDIGRHMKKVKDAGGEILGEPMEMPGVGSCPQSLPSTHPGLVRPIA
jgi:predicted enzyme related to lactoylglutathione lyase